MAQPRRSPLDRFHFNPHKLDNGLERDILDGALLLAWSNRRMRKDKVVLVFLVVFWMIWAPGTVFVTAVVFAGADPFLAIWLIFGWVGTLLIPYTLLQRMWSEWIVIAPSSIAHGYDGFLTPKPKEYSYDEVRELSLGYYNDGRDITEHVSMVTLNIYLNPRRWRISRRMVGYWLAADIKEDIFDTISKFVEAESIPLQLKRYG